MAPGELMTALSLLLAILALMPRDRFAYIVARLSLLDVAVIASALLFAFAVVLIPVIQHVGWISSPFRWPLGVNGELATFIVLTFAGGYVALRLSRGRISRRQIRKYREMIQFYLQNDKHYDLARLVERDLTQVVKISNNDFLLPRLRRSLRPWVPSYPPQLAVAFDKLGSPARPDTANEPKVSLPKLRSWLRRAGYWIGGVLPEYVRTQTIAERTLRNLLDDPRFATAVANANPYLGVRILREADESALVFQGHWLEQLLNNPQSALYVELANFNEIPKREGHTRWAYGPDEALLTFYFFNVGTADHLELYRAAGEFVIRHLEDQAHDHKERDPYNARVPLRWTDIDYPTPVHAALKLFDFLVSEALQQRICWHMWLFYLPHFADRICGNAEKLEFVDHEIERSTPYASFVQDIVWYLLNWVERAARVPRVQANIALKHKQFSIDPENGNIPKCAILALAQVLGVVLRCDQLGIGCKNAVVDLVTIRIHQFGEIKGFEDYRDLVVEAVARGNISEPYADWLPILKEHLEPASGHRYPNVARAILDRSRGLSTRPGKPSGFW